MFILARAGRTSGGTENGQHPQQRGNQPASSIGPVPPGGPRQSSKAFAPKAAHVMPIPS